MGRLGIKCPNLTRFNGPSGPGRPVHKYLFQTFQSELPAFAGVQTDHLVPRTFTGRLGLDGPSVLSFL